MGARAGLGSGAAAWLIPANADSATCWNCDCSVFHHADGSIPPAQPALPVGLDAGSDAGSDGPVEGSG